MRRFFPPAGEPYELFDLGIFLIVLGLLGYVLTDPTSITDQALTAPFRFAEQAAWGWGLTLVGSVAVVGSYFGSLIRWGYLLVVIAATFWASCFVVGLVFFDAPVRALISATIYGWIASRAFREGKALWSDPL